MARKPTYEELEQRIKDLERFESLRKSAGKVLRQDMDGFQGDSHESRSIQVSGIHITWNTQRGTCTFQNLPVAMMWVDTTLAGLMSGVQAMVGTERFALALQSEGRKSVEADWDVISQFPDFREGFKAIANIAAVAGWGEWAITGLDEQIRECRFRVRESWEGRYQRALGKCWGSAMLAGKMAGYCSKLFGTNCWADQTAFIARGEPYDEFVVRPSHRSIEKEIEGLLASDEATRADMAVALRKLEKEMSERKLMEEELRKAKDELEWRVRERTAELEHKNRELQEFAFVASHDLKEPLRKIRFFSDLVLSKKQDGMDEEGKDYLRRMMQAAGRMQDLLDALLSYSRVSTHGREFETVDMNRVVEDAKADLELTIQKADARIAVSPLPTVTGDPAQLRELFQNLIANALKYCRTEVAPVIEIRAESGRKAHHIFVDDNGIGFDEKYRDRIFRPFHRLHGRKEYPGIGMGLAICRKIVERHGGTITARSTQGEGSTFIIDLPIKKKDRARRKG